MYKEKITELLLSTNREGMNKLVEHMEEGGFFTAPCSTRYHLSKENGQYMIATQNIQTANLSL